MLRLMDVSGCMLSEGNLLQHESVNLLHVSCVSVVTASGAVEAEPSHNVPKFSEQFNGGQ